MLQTISHPNDQQDLVLRRQLIGRICEAQQSQKIILEPQELFSLAYYSAEQLQSMCSTLQLN